MHKLLVTALTFISFSGLAHAVDTKDMKAADGKTVVEMVVAEGGFQPKSINVKPGSDVILKVTRKTDVTCSTVIQVPSKKVRVELPLNKTVEVALGKLDKGELRFGCGMNMMDSGVISVK